MNKEEKKTEGVTDGVEKNKSLFLGTRFKAGLINVSWSEGREYIVSERLYCLYSE